MANPYWLGTAPAVAQVVTGTPANVAIGNVFNISVNGVVIATFTATATTVGNVTAGLVAAWNAASAAGVPYAYAAVAADLSTAFTLTASVPGVPFAVTMTATGGTATLTPATTVASSGPNDWSTAANWSTGSVPATGDNITIRGTVSILWGLNQSGVVPASITVLDDFISIASLGLPYASYTYSPGSSTPTAAEYRTDSLTFATSSTSAIAATIGTAAGANTGNGQNILKMDFGTANVTLKQFGAGGGTGVSTLPTARYRVNNSSAAVYCYGGAMAINAEKPGDSGTVGTVTEYGDAVILGSGLTQTTFNQYGGIAVMNNAPTTVTFEAGATLLAAGTGTITTLNHRGTLTPSGGAYTITNYKG